MTLHNQRDWREICKEVLRENDPDKVNVLLAELLDALEERAIRSSKDVPNSKGTQEFRSRNNLNDKVETNRAPSKN